eukprot:1642203-Prymnesium_polylepis.1
MAHRGHPIVLNFPASGPLNLYTDSPVSWRRRCGLCWPRPAKEPRRQRAQPRRLRPRRLRPRRLARRRRGRRAL